MRIVCNDNTLVVEEQINQHLTPNIQINNVSFADIKRFALFVLKITCGGKMLNQKYLHRLELESYIKKLETIYWK